MDTRIKDIYDTIRPIKDRNTKHDPFITWSMYGLCNIFAIKTATDQDKIVILTDKHQRSYKLNDNWEIVHVLINHNNYFYDARDTYKSIHAARKRNNHKNVNILIVNKDALLKSQPPAFDHGFWTISNFIDDKLFDYQAQFNRGAEILDDPEMHFQTKIFLIKQYYMWTEQRYIQLINQKEARKSWTFIQKITTLPKRSATLRHTHSR